jgi:dihydrofolate reductase
MRNLIYTNMASLDGYMEGPDGNLDWAIIDEELHTFVNDQERETGAMLYGRRTYEVMAAFWPTADAEPSKYPPYIIEYARIWQQIPKIVFSRTLDRVEGNASLIKEVSVDSIMKLKEQPGKNLEVGGANLASTFIKLGLIDEFRLFIQPVILGAGKPMYPVLSDKINLNLVEDRRFSSGVVYLHYQKVSE